MPITILIIFVINCVALLKYSRVSMLRFKSFSIATAYLSSVLSNSLSQIHSLTYSITSPKTRTHAYGALHVVTSHAALNFNLNHYSF